MARRDLVSQVLTNRQRAHLYRQHGAPTLALEFDVFPDGQVSMWTHTRHDVPFADMHAAFELISQHIRRFIEDREMCPFHPAFLGHAGAVDVAPLPGGGKR